MTSGTAPGTMVAACHCACSRASGARHESRHERTVPTAGLAALLARGRGTGRARLRSWVCWRLVSLATRCDSGCVPTVTTIGPASGGAGTRSQSAARGWWRGRRSPSATCAPPGASLTTRGSPKSATPRFTSRHPRLSHPPQGRRGSAGHAQPPYWGPSGAQCFYDLGSIVDRTCAVTDHLGGQNSCCATRSKAMLQRAVQGSAVVRPITAGQ